MRHGARLLSWRETLASRNCGRVALLGLLPHTGLGLTAAVLGVAVLSTLLGAAFALASGHLIGSIPEVIGDGWDSREGRRAIWLLVIAGTLYLLPRLLDPLLRIALELIGRRLDGEVRLRTMRAALEPVGIGHLEDPAVLDRIEQARGLAVRWTTPSAGFNGIVSLLRGRVGGIASACLVGYYAGWWVALGWSSSSSLPGSRFATTRFAVSQ